MKFVLNEGVGRWHLLSGKTIFEGWQSMGKWASGYFGVYSLIWGFVYGAAGTSSCALAMSAMIPAIPIIYCVFEFPIFYNFEQQKRTTSFFIGSSPCDFMASSLYYIIPPMSGIPLLPPLFSSGLSATTASVVKNIAATEAAF